MWKTAEYGAKTKTENAVRYVAGAHDRIHAPRALLTFAISASSAALGRRALRPSFGYLPCWTNLTGMLIVEPAPPGASNCALRTARAMQLATLALRPELLAMS